MKNYRIDVNVFFGKKKDGNAGYTGIYGITCNSLDLAKKKVLEKVRVDNPNTKYKTEIVEAYEVDLEKFPPKGYKISGNPDDEGIWGEWKISFKNM